MTLADVPVRAEFVRELASLVDEPTAAELDEAAAEGRAVLALTIEDATHRPRPVS